MASHTPALSHGRRLFEHLQQQQEPFLLEVFLLENGCSRSSLKSDTPIKYWPMNTCTKLMLFSSYGFKRKRGRKYLNCLLPKIVHWKLLRKALNRHIRSPPFCTKNVFKNKVQETKQPSPVSMLEFYSDEGCSLQNPPSSSSLNSENSEIPFYSACFSSLEQREIFSMKKERRNVPKIGLSIEENNINSGTDWNFLQAEKREIGIDIEKFIFENIKEESLVEMLRSNCMLERE